MPKHLSSIAAQRITDRYVDRVVATQTSYATVRCYCDSLDHLPEITGVNGDLKNVQRPWTIKSLLGSVPPPARLLEIGGGEPLVSAVLAELGYDVTLVDPYDGLHGEGPTEYEQYQTAYPDVRLVRGYFKPGMTAIAGEQFDAIFSVSVLEHLTSALRATFFAGIREFLRPGGWSVHCFDVVLEGRRHELHLHNAEELLNSQASLAAQPASDFDLLLARLHGDLETFYLSPQGHHQWRGGKSYDEFPFRKVISLQTIVRRVAVGPPQITNGLPQAAFAGAHHEN